MNSKSSAKESPMSLSEDRLQDIEDKKEFLEVLYGEARDYLAKADEGEFVAAEVMTIVEKSQKIIESELECKNTKVSLPLMDVRVLSAAVDSLKLNASGMDVNSQTFDTQECAEKMLPLLEPGNRDMLLAFSENCVNVPVPSFPFFFGTYADEEETPPQKITARKSRRSHPDAVESEKKRPDNDPKMDQEETEIQNILRQMMKVIRAEYARNGRQPISYLHFIVDPNSFARTIENMFHVGFLVRDGLVSVTLDEEQGLLIIIPAERGSDGNQAPREQIVFEMMMDDWEYIIKEFEIEEAMFKPRRE